MGFRRFGFLAACLAGSGSAYVNGNRAAPARETSQAELVEKSTNGISPVPTSRPELAGVELFKRQVDYTLPFDYCGWYDDYKSASYTCGLTSQTCLNIGEYRGCCRGPTLSCVSTFNTACIPGTSLTSGETCGPRTACCTGTSYTECGTILFSSSADPDVTYTNIDCWASGFGKTWGMQDFPPYMTLTSSSTESDSTTSKPSKASTTTSETSSSSTSAAATSTPAPADPPASTPVGAIVGGVVGGVAVIGLVGLGIFFIMRRKKSHAAVGGPGQQPDSSGNFPPHQQMGQVHHPGSPPLPTNSPDGTYPPSSYDPRYSYAANTPQQAHGYQMVSPDPNMGAFGAPSPASPDPMKMGTGQYYDPGNSPVHFQPVQQHDVVNEAPATNPVGVGNNRAELA